MVYPGTNSVGMGNEGEEAKKRLISIMSKRSGALPLFGGRGRSANDLPSVGAPPIGFNPFLKMLAGRPGENFGLDNNPNIQNGPGPIQGGGSPLDSMTAGFQGSSVPTTGMAGAGMPTDVPSPGQPAAPQAAAGQGGQDYSGGYGHYNDTSAMGASAQADPWSPSPQTAPSNAPIHPGMQMEQGMDPATQLLLMHLYGGMSGYNQDR